MEEGYNKMQAVKRRLYAMRNGIVADALRKGGSPYRFIMGVNLPQLKEIAAQIGTDHALAAELRADRACRESQLLAPIIADPALVDIPDALHWMANSPDHEAVDILCHALIRHLPNAVDIAAQALADDVPDGLMRYAGVRLLWNIYTREPRQAILLARREAERGASTSPLAANLVEELTELLD